MSDWINQVMFAAPVWALPINPAFLPRRALWRAMAEAAPQVHGRLLDVGCGSQPYRVLFSGVSEYIGLELDNPDNRATKQADLYYDGCTFPVTDETVDTVLCNQVLEHVFNPEQFLSEIHRVLSPSGTLLLTVPFLWPEHEQPYDCLRYTSFGLKSRLEQAGFEIARQSKLTRGGGALCALAADRLNTRLRLLPLPLRLAVRALVIAPISLVGWLLDAASTADTELYLDNFVICRKMVSASDPIGGHLS
ncbi:class I SAM-dependent methyltransferase [Magnetovirga frankeli]|uniref:class I SAM-dependent methyltransferase n=1 Tax=Magnetovirga frankeli TaxID=947516 RepID=UPI0012935967|nr:class I SAM-dependent methyltransferase [gamma proteobacterium SS-5]